MGVLPFTSSALLRKDTCFQVWLCAQLGATIGVSECRRCPWRRTTRRRMRAGWKPFCAFPRHSIRPGCRVCRSSLCLAAISRILTYRSRQKAPTPRRRLPMTMRRPSNPPCPRRGRPSAIRASPMPVASSRSDFAGPARIRGMPTSARGTVTANWSVHYYDIPTVTSTSTN